MKTALASSIVVAAIIVAAGSAAAQSPPPPAPGGAFESLSPGNQKIALAIFDSERRAPRTAAGKPLSLDQIAEKKQDGKGWGELFHEMQSRGLVEDRNLGQAVSRMHRGGGATAAPVEITTASGRTTVVGGHGRNLRGTAAGATAAGDDTAAHGGRTAADRGPTAAHGGGTAAFGGATAAHGGGTAASAGATAAHGGATAARVSAAGHGAATAR